MSATKDSRDYFLNELYSKAEINAKALATPGDEKAFIKYIKILGYKSKRAFLMKIFNTIPKEYLSPDTYHKVNLTLVNEKAIKLAPSDSVIQKRAIQAKLTVEELNSYHNYYNLYSKICFSVMVEMKDSYIKKGEKIGNALDPYLSSIERLNKQSIYLRGKPAFSDETLKYLKDNLKDSASTAEESKQNKSFLSWSRSLVSCSKFSRDLHYAGYFNKPTDFEKIFTVKKKAEFVGDIKYLSHLLYQLNAKGIIESSVYGYMKVASEYIFESTGKNISSRKLNDWSNKINKNKIPEANEIKENITSLVNKIPENI